jgi:hypothetical protein
MRIFLFALGILVLIGIEVLRVYYIMPFPGSQRSESVDLAYFLHNNINYFRLIGFALLAYPFITYFRSGTLVVKIVVSAFLLAYVIVFYMFNFKMLAEKMFYQPTVKIFEGASANKIPGSNLVIGVTIGNESKAYPIQLIGYHHQVRDSIGGAPVMITYCTVCRTGRVFSPLVDGKPENFRLVGMDHFNAMFEDATTRSWWRQVNGEAITGPLKGKSLNEIASEQMSLTAWLAAHPETKIMQPDSTFQEEYDAMKTYDKGKGRGELTGVDSLSWKDKSWVVGVQLGMQARAYDWNDLLKYRVLNDTLNKTPVAVTLADDSVSFHVWKRDTLVFEFNKQAKALQDRQTHSTWNWAGHCTDGPLKDAQLPAVQSYQEFWHSWRTFRSQTTTFKNSGVN